MEIYFCGTRGSTPAPGEAYARYGGHTACVALAHDGSAPNLVLDGGTGLANLDSLLGVAAFDGTILLGHLHWDHTHGLPFFAAGARPGHRVRVLLPAQGDDAEAVLERAFSPPHFPVTPSALGEGWSFSSVEEGRHEIEGFAVVAREIPHKGGRTFGYRVSDGASSLAYFAAALDAAAAQFEPVREFAIPRHRIIAASPELQERELIKLASLTTALTRALQARGFPGMDAALAANLAVAVLQVAFEQWVGEGSHGTFQHLARQALTRLSEIASAVPAGAASTFDTGI